MAGVVALLAAGAFYLWWEISHLGAWTYTTSIYPIDPADEWRYTACSRLVVHGYHLFSQVYSAQPPLLFFSLAGGMHLVGDSMVGARWVEIAYGGLGLVAVTWLAAMLGGRRAGVLAAIVMALSPDFLAYAHTIEAEGPMMSLAALSLAIAVLAVRRGSSVLALLAGLALSAAVLTKLFALEAVLPLTWLYLWQKDLREPRTYQLPLVTLAGLALPLIVDFALLSPAQQWQQVIGLHGQAAGAPLPGLTPPAQILGDFLGLDLGLSILAAGGLLALALTRQWKELGFLSWWLLGSVVMLFLFRPLFPHHAAILTAPLAVCAGVAFGSRVYHNFGRLWRLTSGARRAGTRRITAFRDAVQHANLQRIWALPALLVVAYVVLLPRLIHADRHLLSTPANPGSNPLVSWVQSHSRPGDLIAADDVEIADTANRLVVPPLCDPSTVRLKSGDLTAAELIGATASYHAALVLPSLGIYQQVQPYLDWVHAHYRAVSAPGGVTAYVRRK